MTKNSLITAAAILLLSGAPSYAQFSVTFQDGRMLPTGVVYNGTDDTEFVSADLAGSNPRNEAATITVDGNDGGNIAQGAIRFNNLLISQGGAIPDEVATNPDAFTIREAKLTFYKTSPSENDAQIAFWRVIAEDNLSGEFWKEDDAWGDLVDNIFPIGPNTTFVEWPFGPADLFQFTPAGTGLQPPTGETALTPDFAEGVTPKIYEFQGQEFVVLDDEFVPVADATDMMGVLQGGTSVGTDSEEVLEALESRVLDENDPLTFVDALNLSLFEFDVTDAVIDWLVNGQPNQGWAISNNTGDGWDVVSSDAVNPFSEGFFNGSTVIPGVDGLMEEDLPLGLTLGETPGTLLLDGFELRPALTIFYDGAGGAADLDFDGDADEEDFALFLAAFGSEVDGPLDIGSTGDLDFDRDVDANDFLLFKEAYVAAQLGSLNVSVPEPTAAGLALVAACLLGRRRWKPAA